MKLLATLFGNLHVLALGQERGPVADEMHHTPSVDSIKSEAYTNCVCVYVFVWEGWHDLLGEIGSLHCKSSKENSGNHIAYKKLQTMMMCRCPNKICFPLAYLAYVFSFFFFSF